jgi:hypothetical protein
MNSALFLPIDRPAHETSRQIHDSPTTTFHSHPSSSRFESPSVVSSTTPFPTYYPKVVVSRTVAASNDDALWSGGDSHCNTMSLKHFAFDITSSSARRGPTKHPMKPVLNLSEDSNVSWYEDDFSVSPQLLLPDVGDDSLQLPSSSFNKLPLPSVRLAMRRSKDSWRALEMPVDFVG